MFTPLLAPKILHRPLLKKKEERRPDSLCQATPKCTSYQGNHVPFSLKHRILRELLLKQSCYTRKWVLRLTSLYAHSILTVQRIDVSLDPKLENSNVLFLQEHLLPLVSLNSLQISNEHIVFSKSAHKTSGRPSGGLAC